MTDTVQYQDLAGTRPRLRRDVLCTRTPSGVLFHDAHGGFSVTAENAYRLALLIVPHLDGRHRLAALCDGLPDAQRTAATELVAALYRRGYARDAGPSPADPPILPESVAVRFRAQLEYLEHYVNGAAERFDRYRRTRVAVLGRTETAQWCALSLLRTGCGELALQQTWTLLAAEAAELAAAGCAPVLRELGEVTGWADLDGIDLVVTADGPGTVWRLLDEGVPTGRQLLPVWTIGERAVLGPRLAAGQAGCWVCAVLRLGDNGDAGEAAGLWAGLVRPAGAAPPVREPSGPSAAKLGNLLGHEVFRLATQALPAETDGKLIIQHLDSLDVGCEPLLPHPSCPHCAVPATAPEVALPTAGRLDAAEAPQRPAAGGTTGAADARAGLAGLDPGPTSGRPDDQSP